MTWFALIVLVLSALGVVGIWMIASLLQKGLNEHVRAMQAIYELLEKRQQRP